MGVHTFCGRNDRVFDYYSPTGSLALIFQSKSGLNHGKGFVVEYQLLGIKVNLLFFTGNTKLPFSGCNRNYTDDFGRISFSLSEDEDCLIGITVKSNNTISIYFAEFYSYMSNNCSDEYLQVGCYFGTNFKHECIHRLSWK